MSLVFKLLSSVKLSFLPAMILLVAIVCSLSLYRTEMLYVSMLNVAFYVLFVMTGFVSLLRQNAKSLFVLVLIFLSYLAINHLRPAFHMALQTKMVFQVMMILFPVNFTYFFFQKESALYHPKNFYILCAVILEACLLEQLYLFDSRFPFFSFNLAVDVLWICCGAVFLYEISRKSDIKLIGMFFAFISLALGFTEIQNMTAFCFYFVAALAILFCVTVYDLIYCYYKDPVTHVFSKNTFEADSVKKFPLKYSISFFVIDNYAKLLKVFGQDLTDKLSLMIVKRLQQIEQDALMYRYKQDEFVLVFFYSDIFDAFEKMDNMRRLIASTEFVLNKRRSVKLTITPVVSAKKRSDADANAVLLRMNEFFRPKYRFTQNMTFSEEIEQSKKSKH